MLCRVCKEKEATVHLTRIAGEAMQQLDLCEECAEQKGFNNPSVYSLADLYAELPHADDGATGDQIRRLD